MIILNDSKQINNALKLLLYYPNSIFLIYICTCQFNYCIIITNKMIKYTLCLKFKTDFSLIALTKIIYNTSYK